MSQSRRDAIDNDIRIEKYKRKYLKELRGGCFKIRHSENILKCPFCPDSRDYCYDDLLRHANRIGRQSKGATFIERAKHMGLVEYLEKDFDTKVKLKSFDSPSESLLDTTQKQNANEDVYIWPWMAVVANIHVEYKNGMYVGDSGSKLKEDWTGKGYKPEKVHTMWNYKGHSGLSVVVFGSTWDGLCRVLMFMKDFEVKKHGREDWFSREINGNDDKLYAWIATDKDYNYIGLVGKYLKKNGDLKTVAGFQKEEQVKNSKLFMGLKAMIDEKDKRSDEINAEINKTDMELKMKQKKQMSLIWVHDQYHRPFLSHEES
ncbi:protein INVOLVED IN DE NOVO 2-like [Bidens hawaiensis]|uniref:protein INVOLVED IN DE NOVO 2-like n=1 Tax=Bidens hawaiensis TaxID=980011 RepID=UPI00404B9E01